MRGRKRKAQFRPADLERLRLFTAVASSILSKPMSPPHVEAITQYTARQLPARTMRRLSTSRADITALDFIFRTLEPPPLRGETMSRLRV